MEMYIMLSLYEHYMTSTKTLSNLIFFPQALFETQILFEKIG